VVLVVATDEALGVRAARACCAGTLRPIGHRLVGTVVRSTTTQIYEGATQIQRMVMARQLLSHAQVEAIATGLPADWAATVWLMHGCGSGRP
jgi:hypothetical protein